MSSKTSPPTIPQPPAKTSFVNLVTGHTDPSFPLPEFLLFDMDETLTENRTHMVRTIHTLLDLHGPKDTTGKPLPVPEVEAILKNLPENFCLRDLVERFCNEFGTWSQNLSEKEKELWKDFGANFGKFKNYEPLLTLRQGVRQLLLTAENFKIPCGIISNRHEKFKIRTDRELDTLGIKPCFKHIHLVGNGKADWKEIAHNKAAKIEETRQSESTPEKEILPGHTWYIGDKKSDALAAILAHAIPICPKGTEGGDYLESLVGQSMCHDVTPPEPINVNQWQIPAGFRELEKRLSLFHQYAAPNAAEEITPTCP